MNEAQAISLHTTLLGVNRTIHDLEALLKISEVNEPIFYWKNKLTEEKKSRITGTIKEIRQDLERLAKTHVVEIEEEDMLRQIWGRLYSHWVSIEDSKSKKLGRYGAVDPSLHETLDPTLDKLNVEVTSLIKMLGV